MHSELDFRPVQIITGHAIYNSPYKYWPAENGLNDLKLLVDIYQEISIISIYDVEKNKADFWWENSGSK